MSKVFRKAYLRYIEHRIGRMIGFDPPMIIGGKSFPVTLKRLIDEEKQRVISRNLDEKRHNQAIEKGRLAKEAYITETLGAQYIGTKEGREAVDKAMRETDSQPMINVKETN